MYNTTTIKTQEQFFWKFKQRDKKDKSPSLLFFCRLHLHKHHKIDVLPELGNLYILWWLGLSEFWYSQICLFLGSQCRSESHGNCRKKQLSVLLCELLTWLHEQPDWFFAKGSTHNKKGSDIVSWSKHRASLTIDICESGSQRDFHFKAKPEYRVEHMETNYRETLQGDFDAFDISEELGFILEEPLVSFFVICFLSNTAYFLQVFKEYQ